MNIPEYHEFLDFLDGWTHWFVVIFLIFSIGGWIAGKLQKQPEESDPSIPFSTINMAMDLQNDRIKILETQSKGFKTLIDNLTLQINGFYAVTQDLDERIRDLNSQLDPDLQGSMAYTVSFMLKNLKETVEERQEIHENRDLAANAEFAELKRRLNGAFVRMTEIEQSVEELRIIANRPPTLITRGFDRQVYEKPAFDRAYERQNAGLPVFEDPIAGPVFAADDTDVAGFASLSAMRQDQI